MLKDPIAKWIDEELGVIYPLNPTGTVTALMNDEVLQRLADRIRINLGVTQAGGGKGLVGAGGLSI
jgi:hypothetical protein